MARDVSVMFDELKVLANRHADLYADQARLQAELDQARAELARARRWLIDFDRQLKSVLISKP
jgi:hypothetical protein